jgi:hypothetical protein
MSTSGLPTKEDDNEQNMIEAEGLCKKKGTILMR